MTTIVRTRRALLALALGLAAFLAPVESAQSAAAQGITGTMTLAGVGPRSGSLTFEPVDPGVGSPNTGVHYLTEDDGTFTLGLEPGQYWVRFNTFGAAPEWWENSPTREGSTVVTVAGGSFTVLNPVLEKGGTITGNVAQAVPETATRRDGLIEVLAADSTYPDGYFLIGLGVTDEDGDYEVQNLPTGSYLLRFHTRLTHLEGWWGDATTPAASTPVPVTAPGKVADISPTQLVPQGTVSGVLTSAVDGKPLQGVNVSLLVREDVGRFVQRSWETYTDAQGAYSLQAPSWTYRVLFYSTSEPVRPMFWPDSPFSIPFGGENVAVAIGENALADAVLEPRAVVNLSTPTISGTARVGRTLTASRGSWYPSLPSLSYQWFHGISGAAIPGAVNRTYVPTAADVGGYLRVRVTAASPGYESTQFSQVTVTRVARGLFKLVSGPVITGTLRVGETLRAAPPRTRPSPALVRYQWRRDGVAIRGATNAMYRLVRADRGSRISVRITLTRPGYEPLTRVARRTSLVSS